VVVRDNLVTGYPLGYPVYTEAELERLCHNGVSEVTIRLVHEAKKLAGARVVSEENPGKPIKPCFCCGSTDWWLRGKEWICNRCHPKPDEIVR
jgi:hypothetical protein